MKAKGKSKSKSVRPPAQDEVKVVQLGPAPMPKPRRPPRPTEEELEAVGETCEEILETCVKPPFAASLSWGFIYINNVTEMLKDEDAVITVIGATNLYQKDAVSLREGGPDDGLMSDAAVDLYLELVKEVAPNAYMFQASFFQLLMVGALNEGLSLVNGATVDVDILSHDFCLFPVCQRAHWRLFVAEMESRQILVLNSLGSGSNDAPFFRRLRRFLQAEETRHGFPESQWPATFPSVPKQRNCMDCGVFLCQFARYICTFKEIDFTFEHIPYFRERMMYEVVTGELLKDEPKPEAP